MNLNVYKPLDKHIILSNHSFRSASKNQEHLTRNNQISPSSGGNGQPPEPRASDEELYNSLEELPKLGFFNKNYSSATGWMATRNPKEPQPPVGWCHPTLVNHGMNSQLPTSIGIYRRIFWLPSTAMLWKLVGNTFLQNVFLNIFGLVDSGVHFTHLAVQGYEMFFSGLVANSWKLPQ